MRTETQNIVDSIRGSVELVSRRMDRETARHRLEEFNARVEDPTLWNDPEGAQKLMRERQILLDKLNGVEAMERELNDNVELIEMGEMEGDEGIVEDAESALRSLKERAAAQ